jgi:site-specific recombinase XerD
MANGIRIKPSKHPRYAWEASWAIYVNGIRTPRRKYFRNKSGAVDFRARHSAALQSAGPELGELKPDERRALSIWRERRPSFAGRVVLPDLDEIVRRELDRIAKTIGSVTIKDAVDATVARREREGRAKTTINALYRLLRRFEADIGGDRLVYSVSTAEINAWLAGLVDEKGRRLQPRTRLNHRKGIATLFSEAVRLGWCERNPVDFADRPQVPQAEVIPILAPPELQRLLESAQGEVRAAIVLGALCGLRTSEIAQLDWARVNLEQQHIRLTKGKTGKRLAPLPGNALEWLRPLSQPSGAVTGKVSENQFALRVKNAYERAGVRREHNALRHSFCSYRLALTHDLARTALEAGNSPNILQKHYRELVTEAEAKAWFKVRPGPRSRQFQSQVNDR